MQVQIYKVVWFRGRRNAELKPPQKNQDSEPISGAPEAVDP